MSEKRVLSLSVHELVDFLLRQGDIDNRIYNEETMQAGTKIHAAFQKKQGRSYLSEVPLSERFERPEAIVELEGRADGIILGGPFPVIDEIKSTVEPLERFSEEQKEWHFGQAKCYALMYAHLMHFSTIAVRLTYISQIDSSELVKEQKFSVDELEGEIEALLDRYLQFVKKEFAHLDARAKSCSRLPFPYKGFRMGQREMAKYVYGIASKGGSFFCEAPTGIGKTMSALYPALKAFSGPDIDKIFYLTAKTSGRDSASQAMARLYERGLTARDSLLVAKEKICFSPGKNCNPDECPFAKGYYGKLRQASEEILSASERLTPERILALAQHYAMCPFELQLDLSVWSDVIICDYNYFFDPLVRLERYFGEDADPSRFLILVDEAHNLIERGRGMYSAELSAASAESIKAQLRPYKAPALKKAVSRLAKALRELDFENPGPVADLADVPSEVSRALEALAAQTRALERRKGVSMPLGFRDFSRETHRFAFLADNFSDHAVVYGERSGTDYRLNLYCLDASPMLSKSLARVKGSVFFSATLAPIEYYMDAIWGRHDLPYLLLPSPFPKENFDLILAPMVSIRYKDRAKTYGEAGRYLSAFVGAKTGNYFLYFPSYEYLENIKPFLSFPEADVFAQSKEMTEEEKEVFLSHFAAEPSKTAVGLLVIGGSFGEGIDLPADRLIGVAVVGMGLPQISHERDLLRDYYEARNGKGFAYAYMNPGINKVMQAVGRLIRSETDKGSALLLDDRALEPEYRDIFSRIWLGYDVATSPEDVSANLTAFYNKGGK